MIDDLLVIGTNCMSIPVRMLYSCSSSVLALYPRTYASKSKYHFICQFVFHLSSLNVGMVQQIFFSNGRKISPENDHLSKSDYCNWCCLLYLHTYDFSVMNSSKAIVAKLAWVSQQSEHTIPWVIEMKWKCLWSWRNNKWSGWPRFREW